MSLESVAGTFGGQEKPEQSERQTDKQDSFFISTGMCVSMIR